MIFSPDIIQSREPQRTPCMAARPLTTSANRAVLTRPVSKAPLTGILVEVREVFTFLVEEVVEGLGVARAQIIEDISTLMTSANFKPIKIVYLDLEDLEDSEDSHFL